MGDWAIIAGFVLFSSSQKIGQHAYIGGGSLVNKDVPPYQSCANPFELRGVNSIGIKTSLGFGLQQINHILDIYRIIYNKGDERFAGTGVYRGKLPATDERDEIVTFIRDSSRVLSSVM